MSEASVQIDRIAAETVRVPIVGTTPLIVHRFSEKAKRMMAGEARSGQAGHGSAWRGAAWQARHGLVRRGWARQGTVRHQRRSVTR